ncbi:hypothetical protein [Parabacteroides sp.]
MDIEELKKFCSSLLAKRDPSEFEMSMEKQLSTILKEEDWELDDLLQCNDINEVVDYFKESFEENRNPEYRGFQDE